MVYKAIIKMNEYNPGDIVPDEIAKIWAQMYDKSPVELVEGEEVKNEEEPLEEKNTDSADMMIDDYLNRNQYVVLKNIKEDNLDNDILDQLLELEENTKQRKRVIKAIKEKLE